MDPLSITAVVASITAHCLTTAKTLTELKNKYREAEMTIAAMCSETTVISASLAYIQNLLLRNPDVMATHLQSRPELQSTLDTALTGCVVVFSVLKDELEKLTASGNDGRELVWAAKAKYLWNEGMMKDLLQQIRGQQTAFILLIQMLQMESVADMHRLLQNNTALLEQEIDRTRSLRALHPNVRAPHSVFEQSLDSDIRSVIASTIGASNFEFDNDIVNSQVYRRAMTAAELRSKGEQRERHVVEGDLIDLSELPDQSQNSPTVPEESPQRDRQQERENILRQSGLTTRAGMSRVGAALEANSSEIGSADETAHGFQVLAVNWGASDFTAPAQILLQKGNRLKIKTSDMPFPDPWYGVVKSVVVLHRYGSSLRIFVAQDWAGTCNLLPGDISCLRVLKNAPLTQNQRTHGFTFWRLSGDQKRSETRQSTGTFIEAPSKENQSNLPTNCLRKIRGREM